jgi:hypothetical protein
MATDAKGLRAIMPGYAPRKKRAGRPKYPIVTLDVGQSVTLPVTSSEAERRMRKSADNWNARNKGFIQARKDGGNITFTRIK